MAVLISSTMKAENDATGVKVTNSSQPQDSTVTVQQPAELPVWRQKLYYGYNFDIYFHNNSRTGTKENGWSISLLPELGWRFNERFAAGVRFGGGYQDSYTTYSTVDIEGKTSTEYLRVQQGSWQIIPYGRYRLKALFNNKVGVWVEGHLYAGMDFPRIQDGKASGTEYDGLQHTITYGAQIAPVITYDFNSKTTLQLFFSIMSLGYSGTTRCYNDEIDGKSYEYTNDVIIFSGRLSNLLTNQFTPGLYGIKIGVIKKF